MTAEEIMKRARSSSQYQEKHSSSSESADDIMQRARQKKFQNDVNKVDESYLKTFMDSANDFFSSAQGEIGWDNVDSVYQKSQRTLKDLDYRRSVISSWLASNKDSLEPDVYKSLSDSMSLFSSDSSKVMSYLTDAKDYYDKDKNQDAYLAYVDQQNKMSYDLSAGQKKIDDLTKAVSLKKDIQAIGQDVPTDLTDEYESLLRTYGWSEDDDLETLLNSEKEFYQIAKLEQEKAKLSSVADPSSDSYDPEFESLGAYIPDNKTRILPSYKDIMYKWVNDPDGAKDAVLFSYRARAISGYDWEKMQAAEYMDENEIALYNYWYAKGGHEAAEAYFKSIMPTLNDRKAGNIYGFLGKNPVTGMLFSIPRGIDQFSTGMESLSNTDGEYRPTSAIQIAGQAIGEDLRNTGPNWVGNTLGFAYDAGTTISNMAPSILASVAVGAVSKTAGTVVGSTLLGASAGGNAYQEKLNLGYSKEQARTYGIMIGASEIVMEYALGGISKLGGGMLSKTVLKNFSKMDNILGKVAQTAGGKIFMNATSEAIEEGLQSVLEPYIWHIIAGGEVDIDVEEALYSALLGFFTGGVFEGGNTIAEYSVQRANRNAEALELYGPEQEALVTEGLELDPNSKFAQRMQSRLNRGKDLTGGQLYKLGRHNEAAMVKNDISTIQKAAESALTNYGETGDVKAISEALAKQAAGKKLSKAERTAISESKYGQRVANEFDPENIRKGGYNTTRAESLGTERVNAEEYGRLVKDAEAESDAELGKKEPFWNKSTTYAPNADFKLKLAKLEAKAFGTDDLTGVDSTISEEVSDSTAEADTSVRLEKASKKYGAQAKAMVMTFNPGQEVASFDRAYGVAYEMGKSGVSMDYAVNSRATSYLTLAQRELAYRQGAFAATNKAKTADALYKGMGSMEGGRRKGAVKLEGIKASEFRKMLKDSNDPRGKAAKVLMAIAEVTGIDIVLFKSQEDASGRYMGAQGRFEWKNDTIYIDVNAGLSYGSDAGELTKYAMLRTFGHEFTHFLEKNAASQYSEFRKLVFAEMTKAGKNVDDLIRWKQDQYKNQNQNLSYEAASREVVAESMGDILRDSNFVETLAQKHNGLFKTLLDQFKRFIRNIRSYFNSLAENSSPEAKALKEEINGTLKYMDSIVEAFDKLAVEAVENYQARMAESDGIVAELTPGQEGVVVGKDGEPVAYSTEDGTVMLSIRTYEEQVEQAGRDLEADLVKENRVQYQARHNPNAKKGKKNTTAKGDVPKNMKKIAINRYFIDYNKEAEQWAAIDSKAVDLESRGKVINLTAENVLKYKNAVQWDNKIAVREFLKTVLSSNQGVSVYFKYNGQLAIAYLTGEGINHSVGGYASPRKAAAFEAFRDLVKNAEYTFSSSHDEHSNAGKNIPGETIWDFFVSVAMIDGKPYPVAFKLRTIDSDVRSQIYEMYQTKEDGVFHGAGKQESADGHPNYESIPSSDGTISQENGNVKDDIQNQLRTNTLTDHEILDMAAKELDTSKLTDGEKAALDIFRKKVTTLKALKEERQKQGSLYYEAQFGENRDKAKASAARNRMSVLDKQITRASAEVLSMEDKKVLKDVLQKSRKVIEQHERKASLNAIRAAREETRARERKRAGERIEALRQKKNERIAEVRAEEREKASDRVQNVREGYKSSRLREKIRAFKSKLEKNLLQPTERQYVPAGLTQAMIDVVSLIDIDTELIKEDGSVNKAQERRDQVKEELFRLAAEYERLKTEDPIYAGEFDETIYAYLTDLRDNYSGKYLGAMSLDELTEMYEILRAIEETLQDARKLIGWGDAEGIYEAGDAIIAEQDIITSKRKNGKRTASEVIKDKKLALTLSPVRYVERMSGYNQDSYLFRMFKAFEKGVRKKNMFRMEAYKTFEALTSRQQFDDAVHNPTGKTYTDANGRSFRLSKMQMMQAILSMEREQANNMSHIEGSGFSFADLEMLKKGRLRDAISEEYSHRVPNAAMMVGEFVDHLRNDRWAQEYMTAARKFFNETAKDAVNETSMALKHRIIAKDKNYIPFEVDRNFIVNEVSAANDVQQTINSYGMLKDTKKFASNPLIITGLNNILDRHIEQVGTLYGLAIEIRNFNKVWNTKGMGAANGDPTVKAAIQRNWGTEGVKLVEQAVQDVQGPRQNTQSALYKKVKSGYIGATFLLNLSVVTKQVGSLFSANSILRMRDPVSQIVNLGITMANSKKLSAEVDKYTASAWMRRQGLSDAEVYTLTTEGKRNAIGRKMDKMPTAFNPTKWITGMDHAVALSLWKYAKEDAAKRTGLEGEALLQAAAELYDEVIENTQSMSDTLHRPEIQKRSDVISEALGMFKTDLYQMAGQLLVSNERYRANKTKENKKALGRTAYSVVMSAAWAQLMTSVFAMIRYKVNQYRDDEDKDLTVESWMKRQGFALAGDLAGYIFPLLGSELVGFVENIVYDETEEIVDSLALTAINDLWNTATTIGSSLKDGELPSVSDMRKITAKALQIFGIPANNILRIIEAIQLHAKDIANGEFLSFEAGVKRTAKHHAHRIMEAVEKGNMDLAKVLFEEAVGQTALRDAEDGAVTDDGLKKARSSLQSAVGKKFRDGEMSREVAETILTDLFEMDEDDVFWLLKEWDTGLSSNYSSVFDAMLTGSGFDEAFDEMVSHGYSDEDIYSQVKSQVGEWYSDPESKVRISKQQAETMLRQYTVMEEKDIAPTILKWTCRVVTGIKYDDIMDAHFSGQISEKRAAEMYVKYGGYGTEEAKTKVTYGKWRHSHPGQKDLSDQAIERFLEHCEPAGVSAETFYKAKKYTSTVKGDGTPGSKKAQYVEYIESLDIPYKQQRALWYALKDKNWSDSDTPF